MKYFVITVVVIFLLLVGAVVIVSRNRADPGDPGDDPAVMELTDYANTGSEVRYTMDGRINGEDQHRAIRISISSTKREIEILQGYDGKVIASQLYSNDRAAYDVFLHALEIARFTQERKVREDLTEKGQCPSGRRYIYELYNSDEIVKRLWNTSCSDKGGTFGGSSSTVRTLFQQQIPDYSKVTSGVNL